MHSRTARASFAPHTHPRDLHDMRRPDLIMLLALTALLVGSAAHAQPPRHVDPCAVFSQAELASALGFSLSAGKPGSQSNSCEYSSPARGTITVRASAVIPQDFADTKQSEGPNSNIGTTIGDDAFFSTKGIWVRKGSRLLVIQTSDKALTPPLRAALVSLGKLGAPRLR